MDMSVSDSDREDGLPDMSARMTWMKGPTKDFCKVNLAEADMGMDVFDVDPLSDQLEEGGFVGAKEYQQDQHWIVL